MKQATTLEQQIAKLRSRKVEIADEEKAKRFFSTLVITALVFISSLLRSHILILGIGII